MESRSSAPATGRRWLLRPPRQDAACRVFCLPYSGMGASMYFRWPRHIGPAEVCLVQPPGRENRTREPHYGTFQALAEDLATDLEPYLDRPFAFFGHCSSALAGYATALRLVESGLPAPTRLFISSQVAPHDGPHGRFLRMTDDELAGELAGLVRAMGAEADPDLIDLRLGVLRADVRANKEYVLPAPVRVPSALTVLGWHEDREVPHALMAGWRDYSDEVRFVTLHGGHHSFLTAPLALFAEVARDMADDLRRAG